MNLLEADLQNADAAFWKKKEGYRGLGRPLLQLDAIESRHRALAPTKDLITLLGSDQATLVCSSQKRACSSSGGKVSAGGIVGCKASERVSKASG